MLCINFLIPESAIMTLILWYRILMLDFHLPVHTVCDLCPSALRFDFRPLF